MKKLLRVLKKIALRYVAKKVAKELAPDTKPKPPQPDGAEFDFGDAVKELGARAIEHEVADLLERRK